MSEHKNKRRVPFEQPKQLVKPGGEDLEKLKDTKVPTRRVKMLMVNPADFMFLFTKGLKFRKNYKIIKGVPEDAQIIAAVADSARNGIMLVVKSAEYDEVPINVLPPVEPVEIDLNAVDKPTKKVVKRKKK